MTYQTKFIFDGTVYIENCVNDKRSYTKLVDGKEVPVSDAEINKFQKTYNSYTSYVIADYYLSKNMRITDSRVRNVLRPVLAQVEEILPIAYRNAFFNNLKTLKMVLEKESVDENATFNVEFSEDGLIIPDYSIAIYNPATNTISINKSHFQRLLRKRGTIVAVNQLQSAIFHELIHVSSFEIKANYYGQGFNSVKNDKEYTALDEGYTELLTTIYFPNEFLEHGYTINSLLVLQLLYLVGKDTLDESYFKEHGINGIVKKLWELIPDRKLAYELIDMIELTYDNLFNSTNCIRRVEYLLSRYLHAKIQNDLMNNVKIETINNRINRFEETLITKEKLQKMRLKISNHQEIDLVPDDFRKWTEVVYTSTHKL